MTKLDKALAEVRVIQTEVAKLTVVLPEATTDMAKDIMSCIYEVEAMSADAIKIIQGLRGDLPDDNS